jgi:hypothetical protein
MSDIEDELGEAHARVIDFDSVQRSMSGVRHDYRGSSQSMECSILAILIKRWRNDGRITGFVHDQDAHAEALIAAMDWPVSIFHDANHVIKSLFSTTWQNCSRVAVVGKAGRHRYVLGDERLKRGLRVHFQCCMRMDGSLDEKLARWDGAFEHYVGASGVEVEAESDQPNRVAAGRGRPAKRKMDQGDVPAGDSTSFCWKKRGDPEAREALKRFIRAGHEAFPKTMSGFQTQMSEGLHGLKAHFANKLFHFAKSWEARCALAVLSLNSGKTWIVDFARAHGLCSESALEWMMKEAASQDAAKALADA